MRFVMILNRRGAVILLHVLAVLVVVQSHVCLLKKRPDPSLGGTLRWSLLFKELCYCQRVLAPRFISQDTCPTKDQACVDGNACNLWFVDDPTPLTQRQNWNKDKLDMLLERAVYCKTAKAPTETIVTGEAELEETTKAETEAASLSQKTDAVEASTSVYQEKTTQAEAEGVSLSQKTDAVEASTSADQEETTQVETEGATSSQKTDAVEASTSDDQEETTQAETEGTNWSQKTDAVETSTSADQEGTTQAPTEVIVTSKVELECEPRPLGMVSGTIPDENITASSHQTGRDPHFARLYGGVDFWISAGADSKPWIQVDLGSSHRVTGLSTQGYNAGYWVEQVNVEVGMSEASLKVIEDDNGQPKVFDANTDPTNVADIILDESGIRTRLVRIYPTSCKKGYRAWVYSPTCLMRFEILGCREN